MKHILFSLMLVLTTAQFSAQEKKEKIYNPKENAEKAIAKAVKEAKLKNKKVLIQAGGNWCIWCLRFDQFSKNSAKIKDIIDSNYVVYHLNYSPENKNAKTFSRLGNPDKLGFPVFVILDAEGNQIGTQESGELEEGKSYNEAKIYAMLIKWSQFDVK